MTRPGEFVVPPLARTSFTKDPIVVAPYPPCPVLPRYSSFRQNTPRAMLTGQFPSARRTRSFGPLFGDVTMRPLALLRICLSLPALCLLPQPAPAALKSVSSPQGGTIQYGKVDGQINEAGAMGAVLKALHTQYGDRPQVGKLFEVKGTESIATFFSVANKNHGGGTIAGMMIATKVTNADVEVGLVSDDASRFPKTLAPMMQSLLKAWHPMNVPADASSGASAPAAPLHKITLPDNSASVSLPDGWIVAKASGGGTIQASGPNGEQAALGLTFLAYDPGNPYVQRTMAQLRAGQLQNTSYAQANYISENGDPGQALVALIHAIQHRAGVPESTYNFTSMTQVQAPARQRCFKMAGTADFKDGKGSRELSGLYCQQAPGPVGGWLSAIYTTTAPVAVAAKERATLGAILQSFTVNQAVVNAQAAAIAAPVIAQIHAIGAAAAAQAKSIHEQEDIQESSFYRHWDSLDRRSQEFENYQLDYTVIQDNSGPAHGTFWNADADALVKSDPNRYEYVNAPNYWKGIDY